MPSFCRDYGLPPYKYGEPAALKGWYAGTYVHAGPQVSARFSADATSRIFQAGAFEIYRLRPDGSAHYETLRLGQGPDVLVNRIDTCWGVKTPYSIWFAAPDSERVRSQIGLEGEVEHRTAPAEKVLVLDLPKPSCEARPALSAPLTLAWFADNQFAMVTFTGDGRVEMLDLTRPLDSHAVWAEFHGCWREENGKRVVRVASYEGEQVVLSADDTSVQTTLGPPNVIYKHVVND